jgi:hypothetical protein
MPVPPPISSSGTYSRYTVRRGAYPICFNRRCAGTNRGGGGGSRQLGSASSRARSRRAHVNGSKHREWGPAPHVQCLGARSCDSTTARHKASGQQQPGALPWTHHSLNVLDTHALHVLCAPTVDAAVLLHSTPGVHSPHFCLRGGGVGEGGQVKRAWPAWQGRRGGKPASAKESSVPRGKRPIQPQRLLRTWIHGYHVLTSATQRHRAHNVTMIRKEQKEKKSVGERHSRGRTGQAVGRQGALRRTPHLQ